MSIGGAIAAEGDNPPVSRPQVARFCRHPVTPLVSWVFKVDEQDRLLIFTLQ